MAATDHYRILLHLHSYRNVGAIDRLLDEQADLAGHIDEEKKSQLSSIEKDCALWREIETEHGIGAVLDLNHPHMKRLIKLRGCLALLPDECYDNAERFSARSGRPEILPARLPN
jgi:hypothetical protein